MQRHIPVDTSAWAWHLTTWGSTSAPSANIWTRGSWRSTCSGHGERWRGYLWVVERDGPVCLCGHGRIWFLPKSEPNADNSAATKERRRMLAVKLRLNQPPPGDDPRDCHV